MRKFLMAGIGLTLLAGGVAAAQTPGQPPAPPGPPAPDGEMRPHMGEMGGWGRHRGGPPPFMREMAMRGSKAAQFHFARGENRVDIRCAADEPTKACVDAASALIDKLGSQPQR